MKAPTVKSPMGHLWLCEGLWCCSMPWVGTGLIYYGSGQSKEAAYLRAAAEVFRAAARRAKENEAWVARSREPGVGQAWLQGIAGGMLQLRN